MKKAFLALGLCAGIAAGAADLVWTGGNPWKKNENGEFTIDYQNKQWPRLISKQQVKAGSFYRVTFDCKREGDGIPDVYVRANDGTGHDFGTNNCTFPTWTTQCGYFPAQKDGSMNIIWGFNPRAAAKLTVKNGKFEEVTPEMMKQNLIINGNFEDETAKGTAAWKHGNWKQVDFPGKIVTGQDFLNGEKSLELPFGKSIQSIPLPMQKGKSYQVTFWAKATQNTSINLDVSMWSIKGHKGKHFWMRRTFKLDNTWKEFKVDFKVPTDEAVYPDLKEGTGNINIFVSGKDAAAKYYLDDVSYCEK